MTPKNQQELDAALAAGEEITLTAGWWEVRNGVVTASGSASVTASDSASVTASDSASVTASGSASVRASGSASVRAFGSASVRAFGSASVRASNYVSIHIHGKNVKARGGVVIQLPVLNTPRKWCEFYGVAIRAGVAILFKGLNDDFTSPRGGNYKPGTTVFPARWDAKAECGDGLHFSPRPFMSLRFHPEAKRFVACSVKLSEIAVHPNGDYPDKCKAKSCQALYECDLDGKRVAKSAKPL